MQASTSGADPIAVHVLSGRGYVWSVDAVKLLRQQHRLVGNMVGGLTSFTNQLEVHGLPLRLSADEVTLGLRKGWLSVYKCVSGLPQDTPAPNASGTGQQQQKRKRQQEQQAAADDYYSDYYASAGGQAAAEQDPYADYYGAAEGQPAAAQQDPYADYYSSGAGNAADAAAAGYYGDSANTADAAAHSNDVQQQERQQQGQQAWHGAIKDGAWFEVPTTAQEAQPINPGMLHVQPLQPAEWAYPSTPEEQLSFAVFQDLHERGFTITPGSKFGGQYLLYPGDPKLYHAQFVVRAVPWGQALDLVLLKSIARGVHAARKHLLLATAQPLGVEGVEGAEDGRAEGQGAREAGAAGQGAADQAAVDAVPAGDGAAAASNDAAFGPISYITIARETGFVSSKVSAPAGPQPLPAVARALPPPPALEQATAQA